MICDQFNIITKLLFFLLIQIKPYQMNLFNRFKSLYAPWKLKSSFFLQSALKKKSYLATGFLMLYTPIVIYTMYEYQKQTTLMISRMMESLSEVQIPKFLRGFIFGTYSKMYSVRQQEMLKNIDEYKTFSEFFTRKVKPREINQQHNVLLSPADSKVLAFGEIKENSVFVLKGYNYSLGYLLCGQDVEFSQQDIKNMKKSPENKLYHVVFYLAPGDYHRFHSATNFQVIRRKSIEGALFSVKQKTLANRSKVYEQNSRLILHGKWDQGYLGMILVGALNVGRIVVKDKQFYKRGQEIGFFNLGSTVVMIFESKEISWRIKEQQKLQYGDVIGQYLQQKIV